jgi:hypothetical protein
MKLFKQRKAIVIEKILLILISHKEMGLNCLLYVYVMIKKLLIILKTTVKKKKNRTSHPFPMFSIDI